jgi:hypothetical protein
LLATDGRCAQNQDEKREKGDAKESTREISVGEVDEGAK